MALHSNKKAVTNRITERKSLQKGTWAFFISAVNFKSLIELSDWAF